MKVPAWEIWSTDDSWGMRELDTRKLRGGASIEEAGHDMVWQINMGCPVEGSRSKDAKIVGQWLKDWAWRVAVPQLLDDYHDLAYRLDIIEAAVKNKVSIIHIP